MKSVRIICILVISTIFLYGCASVGSAKKPAAKSEDASSTAPLSAYSGPKVKVAVADFEMKTANAAGESGMGLKEMFITALNNSNRFQIVEPQALSAVVDAPEKAVSGLVISVIVVEFEPSASG